MSRVKHIHLILYILLVPYKLVTVHFGLLGDVMVEYIIGILPDGNRLNGNKYLSLAIPTGVGYLRNFFIVRASD